MLSLGAAAFMLIRDGRSWSQVGTFQGVLKPLPEAIPNPKTMEWWKTQPEAWKRATEGAEDPAVIMQDFVLWLAGLPGKPVLCGYPVTFDFAFVHWYTIKFIGESPFGFQGLDIKTLAMSRMVCPYREATKRNMPREWFRGTSRHTHEVLDDAIGQGVLLMNILITEKTDV